MTKAVSEVTQATHLQPLPDVIDTVIIGGGQAGLAVGYYLKQHGREFAILNASRRIGDSWRQRWDSLRLFTPARFSSLPGRPFPAAPNHYPSKDEAADYFEAYAARFALPVHLDTRVTSLERHGDVYHVTTNRQRIKARHVVIATGTFQKPHVPKFADNLAPEILQLHSSRYRNPRQLNGGAVLVVGAGNSGAQISMELAASRPTSLSGRSPGFIPARPLWLTSLFNRSVMRLSVDSKLGRRMKEKSLGKGAPLVGITQREIARAEVTRVGRTGGVERGKPVLEDGTVLDVTNVVWCTGFRPDFHWVKLPVFDANGYPVHYRGVVAGEPGLYFVGLPFLYRLSSALITGVGEDAAYIASHIGQRERAPDAGSAAAVPAPAS